MKLYKKSEIGRNTILTIIILLAVLIAMIIIIYQSKGSMSFYIDKFFS